MSCPVEDLISWNLNSLKSSIQKQYAQNMEFFRRQDGKLFSSLKEKPKNYNLVLNKRGVNILDLRSNALIYPVLNSKYSMFDAHACIAENPIRNSKWRLDTNYFSLDFRQNMMDEGRLTITGKACNKIASNETMINMQKSGFNAGGINRIIASSRENLYNKFDSTRNKEVLYPNTVVYGLLGGLFLSILLKRGSKFHSLVIYEDNIDLFRISLYFLDFHTLFTKVNNTNCLVFIKDFSKPLISKLFANSKVTNNVLKLELSMYKSKNSSRLQEAINQEYRSNARGWGSYEDEKVGFVNAVTNLTDCKILINNPTKIDTPICVVGAGASLDLCMDFILKNKDRMLIFSCGTALKILRSANIIPDFQVEVERVAYLKDVLLDANLGDVPLIHSQVVNPKAISLSKESFLFLKGGGASAYFDIPEAIKGHVLEFSSPFVGNSGFSLASLISKNVIICGIDCGFIKGYAKHSKNSFYGEEEEKIPKNAFKVKGNKEMEVFADSIFYLSIKNIETTILLHRPNVLNIGYGAYINGAISVDKNKIELSRIDKEATVRAVKSNFTNIRFYTRLGEIRNSMKNLIDDIIKIINIDITKIDDLFTMTDRVYTLCVRNGIPHHSKLVTAMVGGSVMHLLQSTMMACLSGKDCCETYRNSRGIFTRALLEMLEDFGAGYADHPESS